MRYILKRITTGFTTAALCSVAIFSAANAEAVVFDLFWEGEGGYTAEGMFSFADDFLGEVITENELDDLTMSFFDPTGTLLQAFDYDFPNPDTSGEFNFNFDSATGTVLQSNESDTPNGFDLGVDFTAGESGIGFFSGEDDLPGFPPGGTIGLTLDNPPDASVILDQGGVLVATSSQSVPEPASMLGLLAIGLLGGVSAIKKLA